jgi:C4-type Zn-finger protein
MARNDVGYLPRENPCAQCGRPIAVPDWIESGPRRISYLWHCQSCDYRFEAVMYLDAPKPARPAIAA